MERNHIKRDILLIPKFNNINVIEDIRKECDILYKKIEPHITLVFPFEDDISDEELILNINNYFKNKKRFYVKFTGISISDDNYIFLNCTEGEKDIICIHDELYNNYFYNHISNRKYIPHITLGQTSNCSNERLNEIKKMNDVFECIIDTVIIEKIGNNDESIVLEKIKLS